jgi:hypothetical protein
MAKPTYQIDNFSQAVGFSPIIVASTNNASPTLIHTADATNIDEVWLEAFNFSSSDVVLTINWGGTNPENRITQVIPATRGSIPILKGLRCSGSLPISAHASAANAISIIGSINKIVFV